MKRRYHVHLPALFYSILVLLVGLVAMNNQNNLLFWICGLMFAGLVVSGVVSGVMMLGVRIRRIDVPHVALGEPLLLRYEIFNRNRLMPIFNIHVQELPVHESNEAGGEGVGWQSLMKDAGAWIMHVGPHETVHGEAVFWPTRRGEARFNRLRVWTTFPFGLIKKSVTIEQRQHTLIYPRLHELRRGLLHSIDTPGPVGTRVTQKGGGTDDYFGLREYRDHDSVRHIAWKRSAHSGQLLCVERSMPSPPRIRIVLDLTTSTDRLSIGQADSDAGLTARELEENAISLAASMLHQANLEGFEVGLTVIGLDAPHFIVRRNHWHVRKMMATLASLDLDRPREGPTWTLLTEPERAGVVVIRPDRVVPVSERPDIVYFTGRQLSQLKGM